MTKLELWRELAAQLRVDSIRATTEAGSGHPTSSMSAADLMAVLLADHLRYDFANPKHPANDHLVFSKGHASPLLYALFKAAGAITDAELLTLRKFGSRLEGHPTPVLPWVEVATGSLGQGLAVGLGIALAGKYLDKLSYRVWVLSGDSEMAEGSVWEAVQHAAHYKLGNLICIVDVNRLGQRGETMLGWNTRAYAQQAQAFGWRTLEIDGHNLDEIDRAYAQAEGSSEAPGDSVATRRAYGDALRALGAARPDVVALDGEVSNSTYAEDFARVYPDRYFEMYIAEQQMVAAAVGLQVRGYTPFASTFAAFLTRAYDFIRMAAVSRANIKLVGSHAGVSIGWDGPSQMGLEDIAMMRAVGGSTVLYPCDANQTAQLVVQMADRPGVVFLRTTREKTPVLYAPEQRFPIGGSVVLRRSERDAATIVAAGITLHEALRAQQQLAGEGIAARVIDAYSIKPIDAATLRQAARETGRLVTVEDHWPEGGLGEAVLAALATGEPVPPVRLLGVKAMPGSGTPEELLDAAGISARHIAHAVRELVGAPSPTGAGKH